MIRKLLRRANKNCPSINFEIYKPAHYFKYLLALENSDGKQFGASPYNSRHPGLHHLCTLYGKK